MHRTWPDNPESQNDFVFRCDGVDVGRCYLTRAAGSRDVWLWTVYGTSRGGMEDTLDEAKRKFKETFEATRAFNPVLWRKRHKPKMQISAILAYATRNRWMKC